jgi:hypothetical protein
VAGAAKVAESEKSTETGRKSASLQTHRKRQNFKKAGQNRSEPEIVNAIAAEVEKPRAG